MDFILSGNNDEPDTGLLIDSEPEFSGNEGSENDMQKTEGDNFVETEIKALHRSIFGILENMVSYDETKNWSRYVSDAEICLKLVLKSVIKNYLFNQGKNLECDEITMVSPIDFQDTMIKELLSGLNNPTKMSEKLNSLEKTMALVHRQNIQIKTELETTIKKVPSNSQILNLQHTVNGLIRKWEEKQSPFNPKGGFQVNELEKIIEEVGKTLDAKCKERASKKYPFGYDSNLVKVTKKDSDLTSPEILNCLVSAVENCDSIVGTVLFETLGIKMQENLTGKILSDFIKNLATPISTREPEQRFQQKQRFNRVYLAWDNILLYLINPGTLNASDVIEKCRIIYSALRDIKAERLPLGIKIKNLCMSCMVPPQNMQKNSVILEKISELKPQLPTGLTCSYDPWPRNNVTWTNSMRNWAKDTLPKFPAGQYIDINMPNDQMSTIVSQKEFCYNTIDSGNKHQARKIPKNNDPNIGSSGISIWDIYGRKDSN